MTALVCFFEALVLFLGDFLSFKLLLHLVSVGKQGKEGRVTRLSHNGWLTVELGHGIAESVLILEDCEIELHVGAELGRAEVLRPDPQGHGDALLDFRLRLPGAKLVAAKGAFSDAGELGELLLGMPPFGSELLDHTGVSGCYSAAKQFPEHAFVLS